jgi:inosine-uridine nucleoside N-ribohydrolase
MSRKVIIDCDPGIDDAVALTLGLFDPRLEVVAVTATGGNVPVDQTNKNLQAIIERLDPPRLPRVGCGAPAESGRPTDARHLHGADGLGNLNLEVPELHHQHRAEKIIHDEIRAAPESVTIITLGPLTNVARAFRRDPTLATQVGQLIIVGGSIEQVGNVTPAAEFNVYCDPVAAREVFRLPITKTLVPLEVTREVTFAIDLIEQLPHEVTRAGALLRSLLPFRFRAYRQHLGLEVIYLHDAIGLLAATDLDLFETTPMAGDVETVGELTTGATVFDRREPRQWRDNMDVVTSINVERVRERIVDLLRNAGDAT